MFPHSSGLAPNSSGAIGSLSSGTWSPRSEPVYAAESSARQIAERVLAPTATPLRGGEWARTLEGMGGRVVTLPQQGDVEMDAAVDPAAAKVSQRGGRVSQLAHERLMRRGERPYEARRRVSFPSDSELPTSSRVTTLQRCPGPWHRFAQEAAKQIGGECWATMVKRHQALPLLRALAVASSETLQQASDDIFFMNWLADALSEELRFYKEEAVPSAFLHHRASVQRALDQLAAKPMAAVLCPALQRKLFGLLADPLKEALARHAPAVGSETTQESSPHPDASDSRADSSSESLAETLNRLRL